MLVCGRFQISRNKEVHIMRQTKMNMLSFAFVILITPKKPISTFKKS